MNGICKLHSSGLDGGGRLLQRASLLCALLLGAAGPAQATVYNVAITGFNDDVKGTLITDGSIGTLDASNIVGWNLSVLWPANARFAAPADQLICQPGGCGLSTTSDGGLYFAFTPPSDAWLGVCFTRPGSACGDVFGTSLTLIGSSPYGSVMATFGDGLPVRYDATYTGTVKVGQAQAAVVPEPTSFVLMAGGLALIGMRRRRRPDRDGWPAGSSTPSAKSLNDLNFSSGHGQED